MKKATPKSKMNIREESKKVLASLDFELHKKYSKRLASQIGPKWMSSLIKLIIENKAPDFSVGECADRRGSDFMIGDDPDTLDVVYYPNSNGLDAEKDCKTLRKFVREFRTKVKSRPAR